MIDQFAAFEQRPDNKLWLFYKKSGPYRLRKAYVLAYTWHDGRAGALIALHAALDEVEGKEIEKPEECLVEAGSTVVFVPTAGTVYRIVETTVDMTGDDLRRLSTPPRTAGQAVEPEVVFQNDVPSKPLNGKKNEADEVVGELFLSIHAKMDRLRKSSTYGKTELEIAETNIDEEDDDEVCSNCGGLGYRHSGADVWNECAVCNHDEHIPWVMDVIEQLKADKNAVYEERNRLVALFASMALAMGWKAGIGQHEDPVSISSEGEWDPEWRTLVVVDTPEGQASWHFHDSQKHLVEHLPSYVVKWDGHDTKTKYARLESLCNSLVEDVAAEHGVTLRGFERRTAKDKKQDALFAVGVSEVKSDTGSHIVDGEFQSNKYPTTPRGKVPLSVKDMTAQDLLWEYAQRRRSVDVQFSDDLKSALRISGYVHGAFGVYDCENCERLIKNRDSWRQDARKWLADVAWMRPVADAAVGYYESWKGGQRPDIAKRELLAAVRAYQDSEAKQTAGECEPTTNPDDRRALSGSQSPVLAGTPEASTLRGPSVKVAVDEEMERCIRIVDARTTFATGRHIIDEIRGSAKPEVQKLQLHSKYGRFGNWEACVDDATKEIIAKADDLAIRMSQIVSPASGAEGVIQLQENDIIVLERLIEAYKQISTPKEKC